jgi:hypothetical protein
MGENNIIQWRRGERKKKNEGSARCGRKGCDFSSKDRGSSASAFTCRNHANASGMALSARENQSTHEIWGPKKWDRKVLLFLTPSALLLRRLTSLLVLVLVLVLEANGKLRSRISTINKVDIPEPHHRAQLPNKPPNMRIR